MRAEAEPSETLARRRFLWRIALAAVAGLTALEVLGLLVILNRERASRQQERDQQTTFWRKPGMLWRESLAASVVQPTIVPGEAARGRLSPDEPVLGILVGGQARAYVLNALRDPRGHLVNDMVGGIPVSVSFCNLNDCARVFTGPDATRPLALEVAGSLNSEMILKLGEGYYFQKTGAPVEPKPGARPLPFRMEEPLRTTWGQWIERHPESEVYLGDALEPGPAGPRPSSRNVRPVRPPWQG